VIAMKRKYGIGSANVVFGIIFMYLFLVMELVWSGEVYRNAHGYFGNIKIVYIFFHCYTWGSILLGVIVFLSGLGMMDGKRWGTWLAILYCVANAGWQGTALLARGLANFRNLDLFLLIAVITILYVPILGSFLMRSYLVKRRNSKALEEQIAAVKTALRPPSNNSSMLDQQIEFRQSQTIKK
jgi:hypothetical protein